jgi:hypothetical protein
MTKKNIVVLLFCTIMFLSCTIDQAEMKAEIIADVLATHDSKRLISISYELLNVPLTSDIEVSSDSLYLLIKRSITKDQKLKLIVNIILHTQNDGSDYSKLVYYFGPSKLATVKTDGKVLTYIAKSNINKFTWQYIDGKEVDKKMGEGKKEEKPKKEKNKPTIKVEPFNEERKL